LFLFLFLFLFLLLRRLPPNVPDGDPNLLLSDSNLLLSEPNSGVVVAVVVPEAGGAVVVGACGAVVVGACGAVVIGACACAGGCPGLGGGGAFWGTGGADENRFAKKSDAFSCHDLELSAGLSGVESKIPPPDFLRKLRCLLEVDLDLVVCLARIDRLLCLCIYYIKI
jgi:hypothetical protein